MKYDSTQETLKHIRNVHYLIEDIIILLIGRAKAHDASKLKSPEKEIFDEWTPRLSASTYGGEEYKNMLRQMRPAVEHHQKNNRHHPEYFEEKEIAGMDLIDLIEMICDWKAATLRHDNGNINRSIEINKNRFSMPQMLVDIFNNTIVNMKW